MYHSVQGVDSEGDCMWGVGWAKVIWEFSVFPTQFFCEPKSALKK